MIDSGRTHTVLKTGPSADSKVPLLICAIGFLFWSWLLTDKYIHFGFYDWDFALYNQIIWNLAHGSMSTSLIGWNFLADHAHYIAFLIFPLHYLFPDPTMLLYLEVFGFFAGAFVFYKFCRMYLSNVMSLIAMILFILHPANIFMLLYEFHFESLAITPILLLFYFFYKGRLKSFLVTAVLLMLIKENMALIVIMFGIYGAIMKKEQRLLWGAVPFIMGICFFMCSMFLIIPAVRHGLTSSNNLYWQLYSNLGNSPKEIIMTLFFNPIKVFSIIATPNNVLYLTQLLGCFATALLSPLAILVALPIFMQNLLSSSHSQQTIYYHYAATLLPFIAVAFCLSLNKFKAKSMVQWGILVFAIMFTLIDVNKFTPAYKFKTSWQDKQDAVRQEFTEQIPADAGVLTSFDFISHLSNRKYLYPLYNVWNDKNPFTGESPYIVPKDVKYALINYPDPWMNKSKKAMERVNTFFKNGNWQVINQSGHIYLYQRMD